MTRAELHNIPGFHAPTLLAAAAHLRTLMEPHNAPMEPTAQIVRGAEVNGYLKAIKALEAASLPQVPQSEKKSFQSYSAPQPETENPNRK